MKDKPFEGRQVMISRVYLLATFDKIPSYCGDAKFEPNGPVPGPKPGPAEPNVKLLGPYWAQLGG